MERIGVLSQCTRMRIRCATLRRPAHQARASEQLTSSSFFAGKDLMGRNSKRKSRRHAKTTQVRLAGEQAEVFDEQMNSDRDWFKGSDECVRFRPEIDGEFNEYLMFGHQIPFIEAFELETGKKFDVPLDWVCVIDVIRAVEGGGPSGCRTRMRCPAPLNGEIRKAMAEYAIKHAHSFLLFLRQKTAA